MRLWGHKFTIRSLDHFLVVTITLVMAVDVLLLALLLETENVSVTAEGPVVWVRSSSLSSFSFCERRALKRLVSGRLFADTCSFFGCICSLSSLRNDATGTLSLVVLETGSTFLSSDWYELLDVNFVTPLQTGAADVFALAMSWLALRLFDVSVCWLPFCKALKLFFSAVLTALVGLLDLGRLRLSLSWNVKSQSRMGL